MDIKNIEKKVNHNDSFSKFLSYLVFGISICQLGAILYYISIDLKPRGVFVIATNIYLSYAAIIICGIIGSVGIYFKKISVILPSAFVIMYLIYNYTMFAKNYNPGIAPWIAILQLLAIYTLIKYFWMNNKLKSTQSQIRS